MLNIICTETGEYTCLAKKEKKDLDLLVEIGEKQSGKISSMLVSNYWVELSSEKQTEEMYNRIKAYLSKMNIEVIDDVQGQDAEVAEEEAAEEAEA